jgi:hypothetical protein
VVRGQYIFTRDVLDIEELILDAAVLSLSTSRSQTSVRIQVGKPIA